MNYLSHLMIPLTATLIVTLMECTKPAGRINVLLGVIFLWGHKKHDEEEGVLCGLCQITLATFYSRYIDNK